MPSCNFGGYENRKNGGQSSVDKVFSKQFAGTIELTFFSMINRLFSVDCELVKEELRDERDG